MEFPHPFKMRPAGIEPAWRRIMSSLPPQSAKSAYLLGFQPSALGLTNDILSYINHNTLSYYNLATREQLSIMFKCSTAYLVQDGVNKITIIRG